MRTRVAHPLFCPVIGAEIAEVVSTTTPTAHDLPGKGWTISKLMTYVQRRWGRRPGRSQLYKLLKAQGLSWKECQKVLGKASVEKRQTFMGQSHELLRQVWQQETILLYIDEAHIHRDLDLGYTWAPKGQPVYRQRVCAPLADRINWYGVYDFTQGQ